MTSASSNKKSPDDIDACPLLREPNEQIRPYERNHHDNYRDDRQPRRPSRLLSDAIQDLFRYLRPVEIPCEDSGSQLKRFPREEGGNVRVKTSVDASRIPFSSSSDFEKWTAFNFS